MVANDVYQYSFLVPEKTSVCNLHYVQQHDTGLLHRGIIVHVILCLILYSLFSSVSSLSDATIALGLTVNRIVTLFLECPCNLM